jgi:hypothetical protein
MGQMPTWQLILVGIGLVLLVLWFRPGLKAAFEQSRRAQNKDWAGALIPIGIVVLFIILVIMMARA